MLVYGMPYVANLSCPDVIYLLFFGIPFHPHWSIP